MAEINTPNVAGGKAGARRSKKLSTKVDLTPMVDLGFLLITFFIFTTTMSESKAMKLIMPDDSKGNQNEAGESTALTVIPLADNKVFYYHGQLDNALKANSWGVTNYSEVDGLGKIVRIKQAALDKVKPGNRKELMLMIKPSPESNYESVVSALDEAMINDVKKYAIMDITPEEKDIIAQKAGL
jgi:biopolymer transport protein ExbD